jgi:hypothetical protein
LACKSDFTAGYSFYYYWLPADLEIKLAAMARRRLEKVVTALPLYPSSPSRN